MVAMAPNARQAHDWRRELESALLEALGGETNTDGQTEGSEMSRLAYVPQSVRITEMTRIEGLALYNLTVTYDVNVQEMAGDAIGGSLCGGVVVVKGREDGTVDLNNVDFTAGLAPD